MISPTSQVMRYLVVTGALGGWIAAGWALRLDAIPYLLIGVPLMLGFQVLLRRLPLRTLWIAQSPPLPLDWLVFVLAIPLVVVPAFSLLIALIETDWAGIAFSLCGLVGALGAGYSIRYFKRENVRPLLLSLLLTSALDALQWSWFIGFGIVEIEPIKVGLPGRIAIGLMQLFQYIAVLFVLEEVIFRMFDSFLQESGASRWNLWAGGFVSLGWALWHVPIDPELTWESVSLLLYVHVPYGLCLSYFWRRTKSLLVPGLCHALGDAFRDALTASGAA